MCSSLRREACFPLLLSLGTSHVEKEKQANTHTRNGGGRLLLGNERREGNDNRAREKWLFELDRKGKKKKLTFLCVPLRLIFYPVMLAPPFKQVFFSHSFELFLAAGAVGSHGRCMR